MRKLGLFIDSDSQYFGTKSIADYFLGVGWQVDYIVPDLAAFPMALTSDLKANYSVVSANLDQFCFSEGLDSYSAIGCYSSGSQIRRFQRNISCVQEQTGDRPYIFSGYNGVVYEKYEEGIYWRCGFDSICVNGQRDVDLFTAILAGTVARDQRIIPLGLNKPVWNSNKYVKRKTVVFAEQVIVPGTIGERKRLFEALGNFARANESWEIVIRPRVPAANKTFHDHILHPEKFRGWPKNVRFSHRPLPDLMREAQALLSVSSTAFFDAIASGITPLCIMDFGVDASHGTHYFIGSGTEFTLRHCEPIETLLDKNVCPQWLSRTGFNRNGYSLLQKDIETWAPRQLPPAFPEEILNTTRRGRIAARQAPNEIMLVCKAEVLLRRKEYEECKQIIEKNESIFKKDAAGSFLAVECYENTGDLVSAAEWLRCTKSIKPKWKKVRRKAVSIKRKEIQMFWSRLKS